MSTQHPRLPNEPIITIFTKNNCAQCVSTKNFLASRGIEFTAINVEEDTAPREEFGGLTPRDYVIANYQPMMPIVVVEDPVDLTLSDSWSGARGDKLSPLARRITKAREAAAAQATASSDD